MSRISRFSIVIIILISAFLTSELSAQSFLSNQAETAEEVVEILPVPLDTQEDSERKAEQERTQNESRKAEAMRFAYDQETFEQIMELIQDNEYQLVRVILQHLEWAKDQQAALGNVDRELEELYYFYQAEIDYLLGEYPKSVESARYYLQRFAYEKHFARTFYYFISSLAYQGKPLEMTALITEDFFESLKENEVRRLRRILSENALKNDQPIAAFNYLNTSDGFTPDEVAYVMNIIRSIDNIEDLEELEEQVQEDILKGEIKLKRVQLFVKMQDFIGADQEMNKLMETSDDYGDEFLLRFSRLYEFIQQSKRVKPNRIGVILPFTSKRYGHLAASVLEGLELALKDLQYRDMPIELVLRDSELSPSTVEKHVTELIEKQNVIAILGPLARKTSESAGMTAAPYRVPVISFSLTEGVGENLPFLFRYQRNDLQEARDMVDYAMDYLGAKRFVIFYDTKKSTYEKVQAFWERVKEKGGEVVGLENVAKDQLDFRQAFRRITGTYRYVSEEEQEIFGDLIKDRESAEIDFDAMYLPLSPERVKMIVSFAKAYNAEKAWILSDHQMNTPRNLLLRSFWRLRFADTFSIGASLTNLQHFFDQHWKLYNFRDDYKKPEAYTLYAYEALLVLEKLLNDPLLHTREALRNALADIEKFEVPSGRIHSGKNGELVKDTKILKLYHGQTAEVFR